jgi:hypothetical protein
VAAGKEDPFGLEPSDTRVHDAWYMMWWRLYVQGPRDVLKGRDVLTQAKARRAALSKRPRL